MGRIVYAAFAEGRKQGNHPNGRWMMAADAAIASVWLADGRVTEGTARWLRRALEYCKDMHDECSAAAAREEILRAAGHSPLAELLRKAWTDIPAAA